MGNLLIEEALGMYKKIQRRKEQNIRIVVMNSSFIIALNIKVFQFYTNAVCNHSLRN